MTEGVHGYMHVGCVCGGGGGGEGDVAGAVKAVKVTLLTSRPQRTRQQQWQQIRDKQTGGVRGMGAWVLFLNRGVG